MGVAWLLWLACAAAPDRDSGGGGAASGDGGGGDASADGGGVDSGADLPPTDSCAEADAFVPVYAETVATWAAQDDLAPGPDAPLVFVGSSSIRRWEGLARAYRDHRPLQRGFGGAQLGEVAQAADALVSRHAPAGVVVFAGTNDVALGVAPEVVVDRFRCLRERVWRAHGRDLPVLFIGITPTPARWSGWEAAAAVNDAVAAIAADDPGVVYVDVPAAFLATGSPPADHLFVADGLHLSDEGYALWDSVLRPAVDGSVTARDPLPGTALVSGTRILVDLGASDGDDGEPSASPDHLGQHWNNWHPLDGGVEVLPGEHLGVLRTTTGEATAIDLIVTGGFANNGRQHGGLLWPDGERLGDLAVGSATGDFFYTEPDDTTGGLWLRGLDPDARYTLRLFASRSADERRVTRYTAYGVAEASTTLQVSGPGAGADGGTGNDDDIATLSGLRPDAGGHLFVDVAIDEGSYGYLALLELTVE